MLWKISVMRMSQGVTHETLIRKHVPELWGSCMTAESVNVERSTALLPRRDRPALPARCARHSTDRVDHQGVPDQFKNVAIAWTVAIGIGLGKIEAHLLSVGKDQLTLAMAIGQW